MLMGLPWLTEIISWVFDDKDSIWHYFWYITDIINVLRGIFIFIMICCKKRVWIKIVKKAPWLDQFKKHIWNSVCGNKSIDSNMEEYGTASTNLGTSESTNKDISNVMSEPNGNENKN